MNVPVLVAIKALLTLSSDSANRDDGTMTTYVGVFTRFLKRCTISAVNGRAVERTCNFKEVSLTPWDSFSKVWNTALSCSFLYNDQTLRAFLLEGNRLSSIRTM